MTLVRLSNNSYLNLDFLIEAMPTVLSNGRPGLLLKFATASTAALGKSVMPYDVRLEGEDAARVKGMLAGLADGCQPWDGFEPPSDDAEEGGLP